MEIFKKIMSVVAVVFAIVGAIFDICYVYYSLTDTGLYTSSTSTYATSVTDPQTGEEMAPFTLNYYQNYNGTGKQVVEFRINCYSDYTKQAIYSRGYQLVTETDGTQTLYYYDSYNGESWESVHKYDDTNDNGQNTDFWYIDIDDKVYAVRLDGYYTTTIKYQTVGTRIATAFNTVWYFMTGRWDSSKYSAKIYKYKTETTYYTFTDLLNKMASVLKSSTYGTGSFTMPLVDMGDFLHVYEVDENGNVSDEALGDGTLINSYFALDCTYYKQGMTYASQSIFGSVAGDSTYNVTGIDFDVNYWKSTVVYTITESDFEYRYSSVDLGYYFSLSSELISELKNYDNIEIVITFNVSAFSNMNVLGFDYYALNGLKVSSLTITSSSSSSKTFTLLAGSLKDTGLTIISTKNITLNNISGTEVNV